MITVVPSQFKSRNIVITSSPFFESKSPVGSSAKINFGLLTKARCKIASTRRLRSVFDVFDTVKAIQRFHIWLAHQLV